MGFFKEFKDDFSQAVNELLPEEAENLEKQENLENDDMVVNTLDSEVDTESELSKLNGLLEQVTEQAADQAVVRPKQVERIEREFTREVKRADVRSTMEEKRRMNEEAMAMNAKQVMGVNPEAITDETTVITEGTSINGDINADGSIDIRGRIGGNVTCNGKLVITGILEGNSNSSEFFADAAKIEGEVNSTGTVKIGIGSVVIGNITASSAVIAGAIKGDIDVQGPVVVDTSAVIMGNIKSRSVQINNGAVIEGFCSQSYADIDVQGLFEDKKGN
ncbi:hypothetical protein IMSAGC012_02847 [Lachnospiraceae bacterium]|jgi:cytoskeletal protein CcmA (bactofilin family)|nr:polymer-forming cytoskeletal protein [Eubacterium sp.]MCI9211068.1 polymer-forming cytoskeletal protein [Eubacterium sp.]GFI27718.1 hypothetical protein IMSAGC012_02847 [Lachnospiraceae bacterium]